MKKNKKMFVLIIGIIIQFGMGMIFGFTEVPVSEIVCFGIWCMIAYVMYRLIGIPEIA